MKTTDLRDIETIEKHRNIKRSKYQTIIVRIEHFQEYIEPTQIKLYMFSERSIRDQLIN